MKHPNIAPSPVSSALSCTPSQVDDSPQAPWDALRREKRRQKHALKESPAPKMRNPLPVPPVLSPPSQQGPVRIKRATATRSAELASLNPPPAAVRKSRFESRRRYLRNPLLDLQSKEVDRKGEECAVSSESEERSESDLSCVSNSNDHANAEDHVYMQGVCSQGGFPTPMHLVRFAAKNTFSIAGASSDTLLLLLLLWWWWWRTQIIFNFPHTFQIQFT